MKKIYTVVAYNERDAVRKVKKIMDSRQVEIRQPEWRYEKYIDEDGYERDYDIRIDGFPDRNKFSHEDDYWSAVEEYINEIPSNDNVWFEIYKVLRNEDFDMFLEEDKKDELIDILHDYELISEREYNNPSRINWTKARKNYIEWYDMGDDPWSTIWRNLSVEEVYTRFKSYIDEALVRNNLSTKPKRLAD